MVMIIINLVACCFTGTWACPCINNLLLFWYFIYYFYFYFFVLFVCSDLNLKMYLLTPSMAGEEDNFLLWCFCGRRGRMLSTRIDGEEAKTLEMTFKFFLHEKKIMIKLAKSKMERNTIMKRLGNGGQANHDGFV